ncbi:cation:proton antiporter domain-containing protein [Glacieibacterium frigidum]|uniref:Sodium:proton antiporter n=1 Tax=Glacieibacterium frigidum TaxID=2593303 RepID=A0A552U7T5_9SPHN|nr:cation:proton antiporter [Glacieibacterium frigidum]TRW14280.1 sodium:proton antiporter [Glacieibacterium frigidum]
MWIGAGIILAFWLPRWVSGREPAAAPLLVAAGFLASLLVPGLGDLVDPIRHPKGWEIGSEIVIVVALFGAGLRIDRLVSAPEWRPAARLLVFAMPLCIAAVTLLGWQFGGLTLAAALLLGSALAPTDPVLAGDVQVGPPLEGGEHPVRFTLTAEAGLNDGLAFPFVLLAMIVAGAGWHPGDRGLEWLLRDVVYRIVAGVAGGAAAGWLLGKLLFAWPRGNSLAETDAGVVALAGAMLTFGATELAEGYGFLAAFVAGIALRQSEQKHKFHRTLNEFTGAIEHALLALLLVALGAALPGLSMWLEWPLALIGLALIFVLRPLAAWLSLIGTDLKGRARLVVSFYGVRGIGTIYYLAFGLGALPLADRREMWAAAVFVIVVSTIVHGLTAGAVVERVTETEPKA